MDTITKMDNIKGLYPQIKQKTKFIKEVADYFGLNPQYVRGHYFSSFWTIPEDKQDRVIELLQNTIKNQDT